MSELIPLLQTLVWPIFLLLILLIARKEVGAILRSVVRRVEEGDPITAGPVSLGHSETKLTRQPEDSVGNRDDKEVPSQYREVVYLVHKAGSPHTYSGLEINPQRRIRMFLDADEEEILDLVQRVEYHLHPTFQDPNRTVDTRSNNFELRERAYGEFNLSADIYFTGYKKPLTLYRYINFP